MGKIRRNKPKPKEEKHQRVKLSSFLHKKAEGRQNRYVYKGFYERLTAIRGTIILGKTQQQDLPDEFRPYQSDEEDKIELESNFITMLFNAPKTNASLEFQKLHSRLQKYVSSYNLVLAKKDEIIDILMKNIVIVDGKAKDNGMVISIIDILVALIKDLRKEISFETLFLDKIFPKIISLLSVLELELLEQIISFFSYCFKYMLPTILRNFGKFYKVYFNVLMHRNKFIKQFAAESFSYVLRKAKKENLPKMINSVCLNPIIKPYKYINIPKEIYEEKQEEMEIEEVKDHEGIIYFGSSELNDPAFGKVEKWIKKEVEKHKFIRKIKDQEFVYNFSYDDKIFLITTVSTIFSEVIYGVQYKLYTDWKIFIDILCDNIKTYEQDQASWYFSIFRHTMINLFSKLNPDSVNDLTKYVISKLGEGFLKDKNTHRVIKLDACLQFIRDLLVIKEGVKINKM